MDDRTKKIKFRKDVTFDEERFAFPRQRHDGTGSDVVTITANDEVTPRAELRETVRLPAEPETEIVREEIPTKVTTKTRPTQRCQQPNAMELMRYIWQKCRQYSRHLAHN